MLAFTVNDTKSFMNLLLKGDTFDAFSFRQGELTTFASFLIEGKRNMDFYTAEEQQACVLPCGGKACQSPQYQGGISEYSL